MRGTPQGGEPPSTAAQIYRRALSVDAMCFAAALPPIRYVQYLTPDKVEALRTSGLTAVALNMTSHFAELSRADDMFAAVRDRIASWDAFIAGHADVLCKVTRSAELMEAKASGRVGVIYCFQMSAPFGLDLDKLAAFARMGVRQIQLCDGGRNFLADNCYEKANAGLSRFGVEAVAAFEDNGVIVDLSHVGDRSAFDAILASRKPVIYSHSGCWRLCPHPRNVTDRNIRLLAERGGVFCVYNQSGWLTRDPDVSIDHFIAHVRHVIDLGGEDHVGVGTDQDVVDMTAMRPDEVAAHQRSFDRWRPDFPQLTWEVRHMRVPELSHPKRMLHLAQALERRRFPARLIEKILGGNYVRVFEEVSG